MRRLLVVAPLVLVLAAAGCREADGTLHGEGTVHQGVGPECPATWHVATADGRVLWPVEDPALQQEGLRVRFAAREKRDAVSICMAGTIVEFVSLGKR